MSNKTSDKNVANKIKRQTENTIKYYKNIDNIEEVPIDILRAMYKDVLAEREQDKKYIKNLELALKIINKVTDIDETKEENVALLKEVLRMLDERFEV